jgi:mannose-1-phosphate guanylyltransferase
MAAAMILCAGLGTRLRPLTDWVAKPMVPIGDAPAVAGIAARVRRAGFDRLAVNVHHRAADVRAWAEEEGVAVSPEPELLGTAGGVAAAAGLLGAGDVLVWNGDIVCDLDVAALDDAHRRSSAVATLAVLRSGPAGAGNVGLGRDGRIVRLRGEIAGEETEGADFLGIQVLGTELRRRLPSRGCLVGDVLIPALHAGATVRAHPVRTPFVDVGTLEAYMRANRAWLTARGVASWIGKGASVRGCVDGSVVGSGARVEADAVGCVIWPGARVTAPTSAAVVTPHGTVPT